MAKRPPTQKIRATRSSTAFTGDPGEVFNGTDSNDTLFGGSQDDTLIGNGGDDQLLGGDGQDSLEGGLGNDTLWGDSGQDNLSGNEGNDQLLGGDDVDFLEGASGDDTLWGGSDYDTLEGGDGNDYLDGFGGGAEEVDSLTGGAGSDTFVIGDPAGVDYQSGGSNDTEDLAFAIISDFSAAEDFIQASGSSSNYELDSSSDLLGNGTQDTGIYLGDDLIAVVENTTVDNFDRFTFV